MAHLTLTTDSRRSTLFGMAAILLWSTTIAFSRSLTEQLGTLTAPTLIYILAGLSGLAATALIPGGVTEMRRLPRIYLVGCGGLFVLYTITLYFAVGLAANRTQVLVIGLINYLWPGFSLVFSLPILGHRARPLLPVGILLALAGIWLATMGGDGISLTTLTHKPGGWLPYSLALVAAVAWGLYSNLSRRWAAGSQGNAVPLFLLASGVLLGLFRFFSSEISVWSPITAFQLAYMALFPAMVAYILWDLAVRKGEINLIASLSYMTPLLSTLFSSLVLNVRPGAVLWIGAGLVILGAVVCKRSISSDH